MTLPDDLQYFGEPIVRRGTRHEVLDALLGEMALTRQDMQDPSRYRIMLPEGARAYRRSQALLRQAIGSETAPIAALIQGAAWLAIAPVDEETWAGALIKRTIPHRE